MNQANEGVIKYDKSDFLKTDPLESSEYLELEKCREQLYRTKLIGVYENGLGYGNISELKNYQAFHGTTSPQFLITGTQTGHFSRLQGEHYTRVVDFSLEKFNIKTVGPIEASSEALTHASVYQFNSKIKAIIHIHSKEIWKGMLQSNYPHTAEAIPYGTKEMAYAIKDCLNSSGEGLIVMAGHEDGVISYGPTLKIAEELIFEVYRKFIKTSGAF